METAKKDTLRSSLDNSRKCQTATVTPAEPGDFPDGLIQRKRVGRTKEAAID
jgi:hypothetical protein